MMSYLDHSLRKHMSTEMHWSSHGALLRVDEVLQGRDERSSLLVGFALSLSARLLAVNQLTSLNQHDLEVARDSWVTDQLNVDVPGKLLLKNFLEGVSCRAVISPTTVLNSDCRFRHEFRYSTYKVTPI